MRIGKVLKTRHAGSLQDEVNLSESLGCGGLCVSTGLWGKKKGGALHNYLVVNNFLTLAPDLHSK